MINTYDFGVEHPEMLFFKKTAYSAERFGKIEWEVTNVAGCMVLRESFVCLLLTWYITSLNFPTREFS